jgi:membrane-associated protein
MLDFTHIIQSGGLVLLGLFLFAEVGLLLGFVLPGGDTLLIAAGIYAKEGKLNIAAVIVVAALAAIAGDNSAHWIGHHFGRRVFKRVDSAIFNPKHIERAEVFYERHGPKTLLIAHFIPVVRVLSPILAGVGHMFYPRFVVFDAIGDTAWAVIVSLLGYYVGSRIPGIDHYIILAVVVVIIIGLAPTLYQVSKLALKKYGRR